MNSSGFLMALELQNTTAKILKPSWLVQCRVRNSKLLSTDPSDLIESTCTLQYISRLLVRNYICKARGLFYTLEEDITKFHFHISVRSNGTNVEFEECTDIVHKNCPSLDRYNLQKKNCKKDHECTRLDKIFRCEDGMCWNITNVYRLVDNAL